MIEACRKLLKVVGRTIRRRWPPRWRLSGVWYVAMSSSPLIPVDSRTKSNANTSSGAILGIFSRIQKLLLKLLRAVFHWSRPTLDKDTASVHHHLVCVLFCPRNRVCRLPTRIRTLMLPGDETPGRINLYTIHGCKCIGKTRDTGYQVNYKDSNACISLIDDTDYSLSQPWFIWCSPLKIRYFVENLPPLFHISLSLEITGSFIVKTGKIHVTSVVL